MVALRQRLHTDRPFCSKFTQTGCTGVQRAAAQRSASKQRRGKGRGDTVNAVFRSEIELQRPKTTNFTTVCTFEIYKT